MVLSPRAVVGESHEVQIQAVSEGAATALATLEAGTASRGDNAITFLPANDPGTKFDDGSGRLMALGHYRKRCRECAANETQVRVANTAVSDFDEHLTGTRVRDWDVLEGDGPICGVETFGKHGFCHH